MATGEEPREPKDTRGKQRREQLKRLGKANSELSVQLQTSKLALEKSHRRNRKLLLKVKKDNLECAILRKRICSLRQQLSKEKGRADDAESKVSELQSRVTELDEEIKLHWEEANGERMHSCNLMDDVVELEKSAVAKDKQVADLEARLQALNQFDTTSPRRNTDGRSSHSDWKENHSEDDSTESHLLTGDDQSDCESRVAIPDEGTYKPPTMKEHYRQVMASKTGRRKIGLEGKRKSEESAACSSRDARESLSNEGIEARSTDTGATAKRISLRSSRTSKVKVEHGRYSSTKRARSLTLYSSLEEDLPFTAYLEHAPFCKGTLKAHTSTTISISDNRLVNNPKSKYIRIEVHKDGERGLYTTTHAPAPGQSSSSD
ncbi:hypothetical protein Pmar_PMAR028799 [Perkinsus marinus ATCC 50983]|uniref:Uncharacterized protein n=1 Tax=Perkinsus marinus (strain ATCC 50983 / TXsc) TaxID=423536 RepID=C5LME6_PERM5|nr:hypothetical protein Pmar_PMAR028799 [Perkinsus marinus ATCC 50983]EER02097.1 hypothetical protein Pmar_PMAR028799 [Perkinsus marinus ATCC 50983]|eukprot:XP_002769379.1 hypothetical protein Pmar_PMAR028799 [Perkinsus marinus ATCC 50983]